jgi:signal transduction histidine kinase
MEEKLESYDRTSFRSGLGLHLKLVMAGTITTFVAIALVSTFLVYRQAHVLHDEIERATQALGAGMIERGRLLARSMAASMENAIAGYNFAFVTETIDSVQSRHTNLVYAFVTNAQGTVVVHTDPTMIGTQRAVLPEAGVTAFVQEESGSRLVEVYQPINVGGALWGDLVLAFDLRPIESRAAEALLRGEEIMVRSTTVAVGVGGIVTLLGIIVSVLFSRRLLRPITDLAADAAAIADGNLDREVRAVDSGDEIGFLARRFEVMRRSIKTYISELVVAKQKAEGATREEKRLRAQIEEHSKLLELKVQERTAELQALNARLTENDRLKTEFLNNVSHELRSPLAAIASASKIINRYGDENKKSGKRFSSVIMDEADRLGRLINELLDLAKIEAGRVEWNMETLDNPGELLSHVAMTFKPLAEERGVQLRVLCPERLPAISGDRDRLIQVLTNLCSNAMKFTPEGGAITLTGEVGERTGTPVIVVKLLDTGVGIPEDQLDKIFDRFHQVQVRKGGNKPKGTGLGLAICREVIAHHGGEIWAEAPLEGGTRMVFYLPQLTGDPTQAAAIDAQSAPSA